MNILIVIPTYNEIENIELLINKIFSVVPDVSILVTDDNSPDKTYEKVSQLCVERQNLYAICRKEKQGLASAYIQSFKWAKEHGFDVVCEMDADFSHNPNYLPLMIKEIEQNDVVIGSRNIKGGGVAGWSFLRHIISKGGSFYSRFVLGFPPIYDLTGGFNMWRLSALEKIDIDNILSKGYLFQIEMKYKAWKNNCSVVEIPIFFENRKSGKSKMNLHIFLEAFIKIWEIKKY